MKAGIIGLGSIARKHLKALREVCPEAGAYAWRRDRRAPAEEGVANVFSREELLAVRPDFIIVSNPTACHYDTVRDLAGTGVPLFIEKPLFDALYPLPELKQQTYVACNLRFLDCLRFVRERLAGRRVNEVNAYCGSYLPGWRPGTDWRRGYSANRELGGGVHIDLIHEIDYLYWLFGRPQAVSKVFRNVSSLEINACDYANYCMKYPNFAVSVVLNYYRRDHKRTLEVVFEDATWEVDLLRNRVRCGDEVLFEGSGTVADTYREQMRYFIGSLGRDGGLNPVEEAYEVLKICLADETEG